MSLLILHKVASQDFLPCKNTNFVPKLTTLPKAKPIGCCPANDPNGKLYGPDKSCCCDRVYKTNTHFCCQPNNVCDDQVTGWNWIYVSFVGKNSEIFI